MNFFDNPIIMALCVILLLPLALKVAERIIPLIRDRVAAVLSVITGWMKNAFRWAGRLVTDDGELSPPQTVAQVAGAIFMIASAVVYTVSELQFTWATLCPMLGGECSGEVFAGYDRLLGFSTVLLVVGFGLVVTDLCGCTYTTHFARIERARVALFFIALSCFVMSVAVGVTMAGYRDLILGMGQTNMPVAETTAQRSRACRRSFCCLWPHCCLSVRSSLTADRTSVPKVPVRVLAVQSAHRQRGGTAFPRQVLQG